MPEIPHPELNQAVAGVVSSQAPDFAAIYDRVARRRTLAWTGWGLSAAAAAALVLVLVLPPPPPTFDHQVAAFVSLVYEE